MCSAVGNLFWRMVDVPRLVTECGAVQRVRVVQLEDIVAVSVFCDEAEKHSQQANVDFGTG